MIQTQIKLLLSPKDAATLDSCGNAKENLVLRRVHDCAVKIRCVFSIGIEIAVNCTAETPKSLFWRQIANWNGCLAEPKLGPKQWSSV
jgi:hypothetical protein